MPFTNKAEILKWFGEHFVDNYTPDTIVYKIMANILTTIYVPAEKPSYDEVNEMAKDIEKILKFYLNKWTEEKDHTRLAIIETTK